RENTLFARTAVNRLWAHFFGAGLVDPPEEMGEGKAPSHPELLDELARAFAASKFDVRFLVRAITASRAYGLRSSGPPAGEKARPPVRPDAGARADRRAALRQPGPGRRQCPGRVSSPPGVSPRVSVRFTGLAMSAGTGGRGGEKVHGFGLPPREPFWKVCDETTSAHIIPEVLGKLPLTARAPGPFP